jgi:hypothetical protein
MQLHEVALFNLNEIKDDDIEDNDKILITILSQGKKFALA